MGKCRRERRLRDQREKRPILSTSRDLKKLAHGFYFVVPTTTAKRQGSWFVAFRQQKRSMAACLHQARAIDHRQIYECAVHEGSALISVAALI